MYMSITLTSSGSITHRRDCSHGVRRGDVLRRGVCHNDHDHHVHHGSHGVQHRNEHERHDVTAVLVRSSVSLLGTLSYQQPKKDKHDHHKCKSERP